MRLTKAIFDLNAEQLPHRQYKYLYTQMLQEETIRRAWRELRKGKTKRKAVKDIDANLDAEIVKMQEMIRNTKPPECEIEHPELAYEPPVTRPSKIVNEHGKRRTAHIAEIREQWYFHIIVLVLKPIVMKRIGRYSCGSIPWRGAHSGKKRIEKVIKSGKYIRYFLKTDIRHFYDNLRIDIVIRELRNDIADEWFLYCIAKIYKYIPKGILIGLYISPWLANYVLWRVDYMIEHTPGVAGNRYMDDMAIFGNSKKGLAKLLVAIRIEMGRLRLKLKRTYQVCLFDKQGRGRPLDFMGFLFFRNRALMRKKIMLSTTRTASRLCRAKENGRRYYSRMIRGFISRLGWFNHTDSYNCYLKYIKPFVSVRKLKQIISKLDKERSKYEHMANRALCGTAC